MANESKNRVKLNKEYRRIGSISKTALAKVNEYFEHDFGLGEIKEGVANNTPQVACPTCPLTTQRTIMQDARALADGHRKITNFFPFRKGFRKKHFLVFSTSYYLCNP